MTEHITSRVVVLISANIEWRVLLDILDQSELQQSPIGQWFVKDLNVAGRSEPVIFFHGGWGKIAAAASAQYVLSCWSPRLVINMGTCGGFEGEVKKDSIILAERTVVYDIIEQMTGQAEAIAHYSTDINLSWLGEPYPQPVHRTLLVSGDRDLVDNEIPHLKAEFGAMAGDWESGAIAWVTARNSTRCLILRGVTDLVGPSGGEAYAGNLQVFVEGTRRVFEKVLPHLPQWIALGISG